jgi:four helix bundle protein
MKNGKGTNKTDDLCERLLSFSVDILKFLKTIPFDKEYDVLRYQLSKSATSIGANYEESQSATYKEFVNKNRIALREAKESIYWLKIMQRLQIGNAESLKHLIHECMEISNIFGSIVSKADKRQK